MILSWSVPGRLIAGARIIAWAGAARVAGGAPPPPTPQIIVTTQPSTTQSGAVMAVVVAKATTDGSTVDTTFNGTMSVARGAGSATLGGTVSVTCVNGVGTFSNLQPSGAATSTNNTLVFSAGGYAGVSSVAYTINVRALIMTVQPSGADSGAANSPSPQVTLTTDGTATDPVAALLVAAIASGTGTLGGTITALSVNGVATFPNLVVTDETGGGITLAFVASGYTGVTSGSFTLIGSASVAARNHIAAAGGNSVWPALYAKRANVTAPSGITAIDDAVGSYGGRTPGPQMAQGGAASLRPTVAADGGWVFDPAQLQHLLSGQASWCTPSASTPIHVFVCAKLTADGMLAGAAADPTTTSYPFFGVMPAGGVWKSNYGLTGSGNVIAQDSGVAWNDGVIRVTSCGKSTNAAAGVGNGNTPWHFWLGGHQDQLTNGQPNATAVGGGLKLTFGRLDASYVGGTIYAVGYYTGTDLQTAEIQWATYCRATFGAQLVGDTSCTVAFIGNSLMSGKQTANQLLAAVGSGTTCPPYVCAHTNTGPGSLVRVNADIYDVHQFARACSGRTYDQIIAQFAYEIASLADLTRSGQGAAIHWEITNQIIAVGSDINTTLARVGTVTSLIRALGWKSILVPCIDRGELYTAGVKNAFGDIALGVNAGVRATLEGGIYFDKLFDLEAEASNEWKINLGGTKACTVAANYDPDQIHITTASAARVGQFFDAQLNASGVLLSSVSSSRLQIGIGIGL